jgi:dTDP-4-amino-4,6-dideoxygalactose transaminase
VNSSVTVPLLDLKAQYAAHKSELDAAMWRVAESQYFILGPEVEALEAEIATYTRTPHAIGCASGSDALLLALMALDIKPGDQVLCPSYTFFATAGAVSRLGAIPVFADIDPVTYNLDPQSARQAASRCKRLKALIPVHLFGLCADTTAFEELARELKVPMIEDAAQAIGSEDSRGRSAGSVGAMGCFSFFPSKNLGCFGDGGMITTRDAGLAEKMSVLRIHGSKPKYYHKVVGINSRLDALQAAVLRVKLKFLDQWTTGRQRNAATYNELFSAAGAQMSDVPLSKGGFPLRLPKPPPSPARHIYNQYIIRVPKEQRDPLREDLKRERIGTEVYYPLPLHRQECFADLGYEVGTLPHTESAANETLALPIYPELSHEQLKHVADAVIKFLGSR